MNNSSIFTLTLLMASSLIDSSPKPPTRTALLTHLCSDQSKICTILKNNDIHKFSRYRHPDGQTMFTVYQYTKSKELNNKFRKIATHVEKRTKREAIEDILKIIKHETIINCDENREQQVYDFVCITACVIPAIFWFGSFLNEHLT